MRFLYLVIFYLFFLSYNASAQAQGCAGNEGAILYNGDYQVFQGCAGDQWVAFHKPQCSAGDGCGPCAASQSPTPGTTCKDGTIYAGDSPDGNVPMYTTASDQSGSSYWGTIGFVTGSTSPVTGQANSADVYAHVQAGDGDYNPDDGDTPNALVLCEELTANGYDDWYLPAKDELALLYANRTAGNLSGSFSDYNYWSSTEDNLYQVLTQNFTDGTLEPLNKNNTNRLRCVRR